MDPICHVAVIGTGSIGMRHLRVLREMPEVQPVAIPMRPGRIQELTDAGYIAVKDLAEAVQIGVTHCIVATDTGRHVTDALTALETQLDVLVEKPLSPDSQQAIRLCSKARKAGRKIFVGCVLRFSESLNRFRDLLDRIGPLHSVAIECQSYLPDWRPARPYQNSYSARADEGGVLRDLIHEIDYAGWLYGWPAALQAKVKNLGRLRIAAEEIAELRWETSGSCLVSVCLDYLSRPSRRRMRASGERGTIEWDELTGMVTLAVEGEPAKEIKSSQAYDEMFLAQAHAFINASRGINDPRLATGEEGVRALAICDTARRASASRKEEPVDYL